MKPKDSARLAPQQARVPLFRREGEQPSLPLSARQDDGKGGRGRTQNVCTRPMQPSTKRARQPNTRLAMPGLPFAGWLLGSHSRGSNKCIVVALALSLASLTPLRGAAAGAATWLSPMHVALSLLRSVRGCDNAADNRTQEMRHSGPHLGVEKYLIDCVDQWPRTSRTRWRAVRIPAGRLGTGHESPLFPARCGVVGPPSGRQAPQRHSPACSRKKQKQLAEKWLAGSPCAKLQGASCRLPATPPADLTKFASTHVTRITRCKPPPSVFASR